MRPPPLQVACEGGATTRAGEDISEESIVLTCSLSAMLPKQRVPRTDSTDSSAQDLLAVLLFTGDSLLFWRYTYVHTHIHIQCVHMHICTHTNTSTHAYTHTHMHICTHIFTCMHRHTHTKHIYIHVHTYTIVHMYAQN